MDRRSQHALKPRTRNRAVVGIPVRAVSLPGRQSPFWGTYQSYIKALKQCGADALLIPLGIDPRTVERVDGLLLVGGEDLNNSYYWNIDSLPGPTDASRDESEIAVAKMAKQLCLPTLGICRGMQVVNCAFGGTLELIQHNTDSAHQWSSSPTSGEHEIEIYAKSKLRQSAGLPSKLSVISRHTSKVCTVGAGLKCSARASDGVIEALEAEDWPFIGIQWHPEWTTDRVPFDYRPFAWLVECSQRGE